MQLLSYLQNSSWDIIIFSPNISLYYHRGLNFYSLFAKLRNWLDTSKLLKAFFTSVLMSEGYFIKHKEQILSVIVSH